MHSAKASLLYRVMTCVFTHFHCLKQSFKYCMTMGSQGRLPLRIDEQALFRTPENFKYFIEQGYKTGRASGFFKEGPLKILADGSLGARTAYLTKPYEDAPETCGIAMYTQQTLNDMVLIATEYGISTAIHAIGDRTIDMALDAFELARERLSPHPT